MSGGLGHAYGWSCICQFTMPSPSCCGFWKELIQGFLLLRTPVLALDCILRSFSAECFFVFFHCRYHAHICLHSTTAACVEQFQMKLLILTLGEALMRPSAVALGCVLSSLCTVSFSVRMHCCCQPHICLLSATATCISAKADEIIHSSGVMLSSGQ